MENDNEEILDVIWNFQGKANQSKNKPCSNIEKLCIASSNIVYGGSDVLSYSYAHWINFVKNEKHKSIRLLPQ